MNIAVLLSGGIGLRMGMDTPKQYIKVARKMLITYSLETLLTHPLIDAVWIVAEEGWRAAILADLRKNGLETEKICGFSVPGAGRQCSVFNALRDWRAFARNILCSQDRDAAVRAVWNLEERKIFDDTVLIHDAVRPNLSKEQITGCFDALMGYDGVMPALPMKDTVYRSEGGERITGLMDRERIFAGQAPEVFYFDKYYEANLRLMPEEMYRVKGSSEPAVMAGMDIAIIPGDENNYKITTKGDLERFRKQKEDDMEKAAGKSI